MSLLLSPSDFRCADSSSRVPTDISLFKGLPHGFRRHGQLSAGARWDRVIEDGIRWAVGKPKASGEFNVKLE